MTNLASRRVFIELALKKRPNLQASYDEGYKGPRWKIVAEDLYRLQTTIPENSKSSLYWNEVKSN
jgi:hypothetical protein